MYYNDVTKIKRKVYIMRKLLAVLMTVMMLVGLVVAALPASAAKSSFDGSDSTKNVDLVITEMLVNSKTGVTGLDDVLSSGSVSVFSSPDAFDYIEIYNRGNTVVNIYDYVILSAPSLDFAGINKQNDAQTNASNKYKFTMKNTIVPGVSIHSTNAGAASGSLQDYNECVNPEQAQGNIAPGEFAVIWFWTSATDTVCRTLGNSAEVGTMHEGDSRTFPYFRDYYKIADDVKIFATNAKAPTGNYDYFNDLKPNWIYALTLNTAGANQISYNDYAVKNNKLNDRIACFAEYATGNSVGIVTTDNMDDISAYYVPTNIAPELYNINASKVVDSENEMAMADYVAKAVKEAVAAGTLVETDEAAVAAFKASKEAEFKASDAWQVFTPKADYVEIGYADSYRQTAIVSFLEDPTPGSMPAWQWMYVDPATAGSGNYTHGLPVKEAKVYADAVAAAQAMVDANEIAADAKDAMVVELFDAAMAKVVSDWNTNTAIKTNGRLKSNWTKGALEDFKANYVAEVQEETQKTENKKDYSENFVNRAELEEKHNNAKKKGNTTQKKGLGTGALIGIIAGAVVLVGGVVAVIMIFVVGKKKKAEAYDDVASDKPVEVIDEAADDNAPTQE